VTAAAQRLAPGGRLRGPVKHRLKEDVMECVVLLDCAGRRRSPATLPGYHRGRSPRNKGLRYPPDPPSVEEIIAVMRAAGEGVEGLRLRGLIVVLWRGGLRISEALALAESDLDPMRGIDNTKIIHAVHERPAPMIPASNGLRTPA
jgi:integrase